MRRRLRGGKTRGGIKMIWVGPLLILLSLLNLAFAFTSKTPKLNAWASGFCAMGAISMFLR